MRSPDYRRDEREALNRRDAENRRDEREAENRVSWRDETYNNLRLIADVAETEKRNAVERAREVNHRPPLVDKDIPASHYNPDTFRPWKLTLDQAAKVMLTFDYELQFGKIKYTFLQFSIKICGIKPCSGEELLEEVKNLIQKYFRFQPAIVLCARPIQDPVDPSAVGVLFEKIESALRIFKNRHVLNNTGYRASRNLATDWIVWNYLSKKV